MLKFLSRDCCCFANNQGPSREPNVQWDEGKSASFARSFASNRIGQGSLETKFWTQTDPARQPIQRQEGERMCGTLPALALAFRKSSSSRQLSGGDISLAPASPAMAERAASTTTMAAPNLRCSQAPQKAGAVA